MTDHELEVELPLLSLAVPIIPEFLYNIRHRAEGLQFSDIKDEPWPPPNTTTPSSISDSSLSNSTSMTEESYIFESILDNLRSHFFF